MTYKSKRAKACDIPQKVKEKVFERDGGVCVFCQSGNARPNAHFIARSQNGLGIEENILTLCSKCHDRYDRTTDRQQMREFFKRYLQSKYAGWNEEKLIYKKWSDYGNIQSKD